MRLLDLVCHKLGADDARIEIGGKAPDDSRIIWAPIEEGRRLVALFKATPLDRAATEGRLLALLEGFRETLALPPEPAYAGSSHLSRELDEALAALAARTGAETVWIIDVHSPVLWGSSEPHSRDLDLDDLRARRPRRPDAGRGQAVVGRAARGLPAGGPGAAAQQRAERRDAAHRAASSSRRYRALTEQGGLAAAARRLRSARALVEIRERAARDRELVRSELRGPSIQCFAHAIAGQYQLVLVFDETYSPLHAEGHVQRALPHIERLLLALPPVDPARVARGAPRSSACHVRAERAARRLVFGETAHESRPRTVGRPVKII